MKNDYKFAQSSFAIQLRIIKIFYGSQDLSNESILYQIGLRNMLCTVFFNFWN